VNLIPTFTIDASGISGTDPIAFATLAPPSWSSGPTVKVKNRQQPAFSRVADQF
jgi:hypothetical protein